MSSFIVENRPRKDAARLMTMASYRSKPSKVHFCIPGAYGKCLEEYKKHKIIDDKTCIIGIENKKSEVPKVEEVIKKHSSNPKSLVCPMDFKKIDFFNWMKDEKGGMLQATSANLDFYDTMHGKLFDSLELFFDHYVADHAHVSTTFCLKLRGNRSLQELPHINDYKVVEHFNMRDHFKKVKDNTTIDTDYIAGIPSTFDTVVKAANQTVSAMKFIANMNFNLFDERKVLYKDVTRNQNGVACKTAMVTMSWLLKRK